MIVPDGMPVLIDNAPPVRLCLPKRRPLATLVLLLLVALSALAGCTDEADVAAAPTTVRDSAGVRIVETDPAGLPAWSAEPEPILSIGSLDGVDDALYRVTGVDRLSDGSWVTASRGLSEIRLFDQDGAFLRAIGGPGEGPGEFTGLANVFVLPGDSILAWDLSRRRATVFGPRHEIVREFTPAAPEGGSPASPVAVLDEGTLLLDGGSVFGGDEEGPTDGDLIRPETRTLLADMSGAQGPALDRMPGAEMWMVANEQFVSVRSVPFAKASRADGGAGRTFTGITDRAELRVWNLDGEEVERWRVDVEPPVVGDEDWTRARHAELASIEDPEQRRTTADFYDEVPRPERHPAWTDLVVSTEGGPWLQRFAAPGVDEPALWWVFDETGAVERVVRLPAGLDVMWIRGDTVAGIERDELDVEYLRVYRVVPEA